MLLENLIPYRDNRLPTNSENGKYNGRETRFGRSNQSRKPTAYYVDDGTRCQEQTIELRAEHRINVLPSPLTHGYYNGRRTWVGISTEHRKPTVYYVDSGYRCVPQTEELRDEIAGAMAGLVIMSKLSKLLEGDGGLSDRASSFGGFQDDDPFGSLFKSHRMGGSGLN